MCPEKLDHYNLTPSRVIILSRSYKLQHSLNPTPFNETTFFNPPNVEYAGRLEPVNNSVYLRS